ncbi:MAG: HEAT repeat domain-containing protein, partial [Leptolyngbyaceae cyanobacterium bins.59]|nr:HEAT repeat domain-containing protein [Leptolyngbyaceae cyanobacterium bins.59]
MSVSPESVSQLLASDDFGDRLRAVNQIRQLEQATAFELIQQAAADRNVRVRYAAVSQFSSLGHQNREVSLKLLRDCLLQDSESDVQAAAADSIGALKLTEAFDDLKQVYETTSEWLVKFSIVAALGELGDRRSFTLLEDALNSTVDLIQAAAIGALGELGDPRAVPLLIPYISHPDWQVRFRTAKALGLLGSSEARPALESLLEDPV